MLQKMLEAAFQFGEHSGPHRTRRNRIAVPIDSGERRDERIRKTVANQAVERTPADGQEIIAPSLKVR